MDVAYAMINNWNDSYLVPDYSYAIVEKSPSYLNSLTPVVEPKAYVVTTKTITNTIYNADVVVYFPLNKYKIPSVVSNKVKDNFKDFNVLSVSTVYGMASPEGSKSYNYRLALKRAVSLANLFNDKDYGFSVVSLGECNVKSRSLCPQCRKAYTTVKYSKVDTQEDSVILYSYDGINFFDGKSNPVSTVLNVNEVIKDVIIKRLEDVKKEVK